MFKLFLLSGIITLSTQCPHGWENYANKKCLLYDNVNKIHADAVKFCADKKAQLVSITTQEEQSFIEKLARKHSKSGGVHWVWLGATRPHEETNKFEWPDGNEVNFTRWRNGCPDRRSGENCVLLTVFKDRPGHWCNFKCDGNHDHAICERPFVANAEEEDEMFATETPDHEFDLTESSELASSSNKSDESSETKVCPQGWERFQYKCYIFHNDNVTGDEAKHVCKHKYLNSTVVSVTSDDINEFLVEYLFYIQGASDGVWLGARRLKENQTEFIWSNGETFNYTKWGYREPDNRYVEGPENCVLLNQRRYNFGRWLDVPCHLRFLLVCEKNINNINLQSQQSLHSPSSSTLCNDKIDSEHYYSGSRNTVVALSVLLSLALLITIALLITFYSLRKKFLSRFEQLPSRSLNFSNVSYLQGVRNCQSNNYCEQQNEPEAEQTYSEVIYNEPSYNNSFNRLLI